MRHWYLGKLHMAARRDAALTKTFLEVANLMAPPSRILHPLAAARVLLGQRPARRGEVARSPGALAA